MEITIPPYIPFSIFNARFLKINSYSYAPKRASMLSPNILTPDFWKLIEIFFVSF